jgi:hypothetical protein
MEKGIKFGAIIIQVKKCLNANDADGADLLIPFFIGDGRGIKFGAIIIQVTKCLNANDAKEVSIICA